MSEITCYAHVCGEASNDEDEGIQGLYEVVVHLSETVDIDDLSSEHADKIATAVLDEFHVNQGIEEVDDFEISVYLSNGVRISEESDLPDTDFEASAFGCEKIDHVPESIAPAIESLVA